MQKLCNGEKLECCIQDISTSSVCMTPDVVTKGVKVSFQSSMDEKSKSIFTPAIVALGVEKILFSMDLLKSYRASMLNLFHFKDKIIDCLDIVVETLQ